MEAQARKFGVEMLFTEISRVAAEGDGFTLTADSGDTFHCRALIIAAGASPVKLDVPGVTLFSGGCELLRHLRWTVFPRH